MLNPRNVDKALEIARKRPANYEYFFERLQSPDWIAPLKERGLFSDAPKPEIEGDQVLLPLWPESRYLSRMAGLAPEAVRDVILQVPETQNTRVHEDFVSAAAGMPPEVAAGLVPYVKTWLDTPYTWLLPDRLSDLIIHLSAGGLVAEALDLAAAVLALKPEWRGEESAIDLLSGPPEPHTRFSEWHYARILSAITQPLIAAAGTEALGLLCDLLEQALEFSHRPEQNMSDGREDFSYIWRPAIEDDSTRYSDGVQNILTSAVRDAGALILSEGKGSLDSVMEHLARHKWPVFDRVALHLIRTHLDTGAGLAAERLLDSERFRRVGIRHEYWLLLRDAFATLSNDDRSKFLQWLEVMPSRIADSGENAPTRFAVWQRNWLSAISGYLPARWDEHYRELVDVLGPAEHPEYPFHIGEWRSGPTSPATADALADMSTDALIEYLRTWASPDGPTDPSPEGLGRQLERLVAANPRRYADAALAFRSITEPTYVNAYFRGIRRAANEGRLFPWKPILCLADWAASQPREIMERPLRPDDDRDPHWGWTRQSVASLLSAGLKWGRGRIPVRMRNRVWDLLEVLTRDPDPTPEHEATYGGANQDPSTMSINTVRGEAMHAVIRYALWVRRYLESRPCHAAPSLQGFEEMPEVRQVLEWHLDPENDPSLAIRSAYGKWLPQLVLLDQNWTAANVDRIFPLHPDMAHLRDAAWEAYLTFAQLYGAVYDVLRGEYTRAVERLGASCGERRVLGDPDERLGEHLMTIYWWGRIGLDELSALFERAPADLRGHCLSFVGHSICAHERRLSKKETARLRELWEWRLSQARCMPKSEARAELANFGWWLPSKCFSERWLLAQLAAVLQLTHWAEPDNDVMEYLSDLASRKPLVAVQLASQMAEGDTQGWGVSAGWERELRHIIGTALQSKNVCAQAAAQTLLGRLGARGFRQYRDLMAARAEG